MRKLENELGKSEGLQKARTALELEVGRPSFIAWCDLLIQEPLFLD